MNEEFLIHIGKRKYKVLKELADILNLEIDDLVNKALEELFQYIRNDTGIFLESLGLLETLKKTIKME